MNFLFSTRRVLLWDKEQQRLSWMKRHVSLSLYFRVWIPRERGEGNAITKVIDSESWGEGLENPKRLSSLWWWRKGSFRGVNHPPQRRSNLKQIKWSRNEKMSLLTRLAFLWINCFSITRQRQQHHWYQGIQNIKWQLEVDIQVKEHEITRLQEMSSHLVFLRFSCSWLEEEQFKSRRRT